MGLSSLFHRHTIAEKNPTKLLSHINSCEHTGNGQTHAAKAKAKAKTQVIESVLLMNLSICPGTALCFCYTRTQLLWRW